MNTTGMQGELQDMGGNVKEGVGRATGDRSLQAEGRGDQLAGNVKQATGAAKDALANAGPMVDKARAFARERPWATAALVGTIGLAIANTLRGR